MSPATKEFFKKIHEILEEVERTQFNQIERAAELIADSVHKGGIVYTFGTGHSHCVAEELCYRAGGLVPVDAMLEPSFTGNTQVVKSGFAEQVEGFGEIILDYWKVTPGDVLLVISNSGRNAGPIEVAMKGQERKIPVISIVSDAYVKGTKSRHSSRKNLVDFSDVVIDNCGLLGDALVKLEGLKQPMGPTSNIIAMAIAHAVTIKAVEIMLDRGFEPPVFMSGNLDEAWEYNNKLLEKYWGRIRLW
jgi:uncharacterized phosphosugar-binding protein